MGRDLLGVVRGVPYYIDRSNWSYAKQRAAQRNYEIALKTSRAEAQQARMEASIKKRDEQRARTAAQEKSYEKRLRLGKEEPERKTGSSITGNKSSTFDAAAQRNRANADLALAARGSQKAIQRIIENQPPQERETITLGQAVDLEQQRLAAKYPGYTPKDQNLQRENIARKLIGSNDPGLPDSAYYQAYKGPDPNDSLKDIAQSQREIYISEKEGKAMGEVKTPWGRSAVSMMPAVKALHARNQVEFGGAMAGELRPEYAIGLGLKNLFHRNAEGGTRSLFAFSGLREARDQVPMDLLMKAPEYSTVTLTEEAQKPYSILNVSTGETLRFRTEAAALGFKNRQDAALQEQALRESGMTLAQVQDIQNTTRPFPFLIPKSGDVPESRGDDVGVEITRVQSMTPTSSPKVIQASMIPDIGISIPDMLEKVTAPVFSLLGPKYSPYVHQRFGLSEAEFRQMTPQQQFMLDERSSALFYEQGQREFTRLISDVGIGATSGAVVGLPAGPIGVGVGGLVGGLGGLGVYFGAKELGRQVSQRTPEDLAKKIIITSPPVTLMGRRDFAMATGLMQEGKGQEMLGGVARFGGEMFGLVGSQIMTGKIATGQLGLPLRVERIQTPMQDTWAVGWKDKPWAYVGRIEGVNQGRVTFGLGKSLVQKWHIQAGESFVPRGAMETYVTLEGVKQQAAFPASEQARLTAGYDIMKQLSTQGSIFRQALNIGGLTKIYEPAAIKATETTLKALESSTFLVKGSAAQITQLDPSLPNRIGKDIDIGVIDITPQKFREVLITNLDKFGASYKLEGDDILLKQAGGDYQKAFDIKSRKELNIDPGEPTAPEELRFGFSVQHKPIVMDGVQIQSLSEQLIRKGAEAIRIHSTFLNPSHAGREFKDIYDFQESITPTLITSAKANPLTFQRGANAQRSLDLFKSTRGDDITIPGIPENYDPLKNFKFRGKVYKPDIHLKNIIEGTPTDRSILSGETGNLQFHHIDKKADRGVLLTYNEHRSIEAQMLGLIPKQNYYNALKVGKLTPNKMTSIQGLFKPNPHLPSVQGSGSLGGDFYYMSNSARAKFFRQYPNIRYPSGSAFMPSSHSIYLPAPNIRMPSSFIPSGSSMGGPSIYRPPPIKPPSIYTPASGPSVFKSPPSVITTTYNPTQYPSYNFPKYPTYHPSYFFEYSFKSRPWTPPKLFVPAGSGRKSEGMGWSFGETWVTHNPLAEVDELLSDMFGDAQPRKRRRK